MLWNLFMLGAFYMHVISYVSIGQQAWNDKKCLMFSQKTEIAKSGNFFWFTYYRLQAGRSCPTSRSAEVRFIHEGGSWLYVRGFYRCALAPVLSSSNRCMEDYLEVLMSFSQMKWPESKMSIVKQRQSDGGAQKTEKTIVDRFFFSIQWSFSLVRDRSCCFSFYRCCVGCFRKTSKLRCWHKYKLQ